MQAETITRNDKVEILSPDEFEAKRIASIPTGYHNMGFNCGAPTDGLVTMKINGTRYLVDGTGAGEIYRYAEAD